MILTYEEVKLVLKTIVEISSNDGNLIELMILLDQLKDLHRPIFLPLRYEEVLNKHLPLYMQ